MEITAKFYGTKIHHFPTLSFKPEPEEFVADRPVLANLQAEREAA